jgi:hypothetical protein
MRARALCASGTLQSREDLCRKGFRLVCAPDRLGSRGWCAFFTKHDRAHAQVFVVEIRGHANREIAVAIQQTQQLTLSADASEGRPMVYLPEKRRDLRSIGSRLKPDRALTNRRQYSESENVQPRNFDAEAVQPCTRKNNGIPSL